MNLRVKPVPNESPQNSLKQIKSLPNSKLFVPKGLLTNYFNSHKILSPVKSCEKSHKDSASDLEFSSATTPCCCSESYSKRNIATNTEIIYSSLIKPIGNLDSLQPQFHNNGTSCYFMFPIYAVNEQSIQTDLSHSSPNQTISTLSGKSIFIFPHHEIIGKKCENSEDEESLKLSESKLRQKIMKVEGDPEEKGKLCINEILSEDLKKR